MAHREARLPALVLDTVDVLERQALPGEAVRAGTVDVRPARRVARSDREVGAHAGMVAVDVQRSLAVDRFAALARQRELLEEQRRRAIRWKLHDEARQI